MFKGCAIYPGMVFHCYFSPQPEFAEQSFPHKYGVGRKNRTERGAYLSKIKLAEGTLFFGDN